MNHYRAFISSLLHTSIGGKESLGKEEWSLGKLGRLCIPEGRKHTFFIASNGCATRVVGMEDTDTASQEVRVRRAGRDSAAQRAGLMTLLLLPGEAPSSWGKEVQGQPCFPWAGMARRDMALPKRCSAFQTSAECLSACVMLRARTLRFRASVGSVPGRSLVYNTHKSAYNTDPTWRSAGV